MKKDDVIDAALRDLPHWQPPPGFAARVAAAAIVDRNVATRVRAPGGLFLMARLSMPLAAMLVGALLLGALWPAGAALAADYEHALLAALAVTCVTGSLVAAWWFSRDAFARLAAGAHLPRARQ